ncbi:hypothetical protein T01_780 [Trichinella spiralis]|uniref:Uncharacterized protein n=1 Tax=Trichinella spiralis TaxID=6334 RepID=A0A0V1C2N7_TRISP|nr:hypothetical protein T01_780 [Trichinella spiralis]
MQASISDVLQLHTEKSIRNVRPMLMEEQRERKRIKWITSPLIENKDKFKFKKFHPCKWIVETIEYNSFELRLTSFEAFLFGRLLLAINTSQYIFEGAKDPETRRMM